MSKRESGARCCWFDLGNVILFFDHERMFRQIAALCGVAVDRVRDAYTREGVGALYEAGKVSTDQLLARCSEWRGAPVRREDFVRAAGDIFVLNAPMVELIGELRQRGTRLVLLSNTSEAHMDWVRATYDFLGLFDALVLSYEVGAMKPDRSIYEAALRVSGVPAEECFYTDDIEAYVEAARAMGVDAHLYQDVPATRALMGL